MRRTFNFLLLFFLSVMTVMAAPGDLQEKLAALKGISGIEKLQSDYYPEKYVVRITQQVDPKDPAAGTFTQRVIVGHVGYDRPTIMVTEGYGAAYALNLIMRIPWRSLGERHSWILVPLRDLPLWIPSRLPVLFIFLNMRINGSRRFRLLLSRGKRKR